MLQRLGDALVICTQATGSPAQAKPSEFMEALKQLVQTAVIYSETL